MLLDQATPRNVSRALSEINAFEWEGDFKPMARQALKELVHKQLEQEMAEYLGLSRYEHAVDRHDYRNGHYVRHLLSEMGDLEVLVPRSRKGKFPTKLFERYARRCGSSRDKVLLACFCLGLSTRKPASVLVPVLGEKVSRPQRFHASRGIWIGRSVAITTGQLRITTAISSFALAIRQVEIGLASMVSLLFGLTVNVYGVVLPVDSTYPKWLGGLAWEPCLQ